MDVKNFVAILLCTLMAACGNDKAGPENSTTKQTKASILLSVDGVGPINAQTPFNMHQLTLDFPDYSVEEFTDKKVPDKGRIIRVSENGKPILILHPGQDNKRIYSIIIQSTQVENSLGHSLGTAFSDIYSYELTEPCTTGTDELTGKVLCFAPKTPNILYVFAGHSDSPADQTPPPGILASWKLDAIIWKPAG